MRLTTSIAFTALALMFLLPTASSAAEQQENCVCVCDDGTTTTRTGGPYSTAVRLSEIYPAPATGEEEFIELYNSGASTVDLEGWILTDESGKTFTISGESMDSTTIYAGAYFVVPQSASKLYLNNSGDGVYLYHPDSQLLDFTVYESADTGDSWSQVDGVWQWAAEVTEGARNRGRAIDEEGDNDDGDSSESDEEGDEDSDSTGIIAISDFRELEDDDQATVEGVVTVLPGVFGTQYFYIQDSSAGLQVYSYHKYFPELEVGDVIRVSGEKATSREEARIKTASEEDIQVIDHLDELDAVPVGELEEQVEGMLVRVDGQVTDKSGSNVILNEVVKIVLKAGANIDKSLLDKDNEVVVTGIATQYDDEYRLQPRSSDDIMVANDEFALIPAAEAASLNPTSLDEQQPDEQSKALLIILAIGAATIAAGYLINSKKEALTSFINIKRGHTRQRKGHSLNSKRSKNAATKPRTIFDAAPTLNTPPQLDTAQKKEGA